MTPIDIQVVTATFVLLYLFTTNVPIAAVIPSINASPTIVNGTDNISQVQEERVDIFYNTYNLKEISRDGILKLQVIRTPSVVDVNCQYTGNVSDQSHAFVDWTYEGLDEV